MTTEDDWRRAVAEAGGDDTPRLAFADWLDDHGRPDLAARVRDDAGRGWSRCGRPGRSRG